MLIRLLYNNKKGFYTQIMFRLIRQVCKTLSARLALDSNSAYMFIYINTIRVFVNRPYVCVCVRLWLYIYV